MVTWVTSHRDRHQRFRELHSRHADTKHAKSGDAQGIFSHENYMCMAKLQVVHVI